MVGDGLVAVAASTVGVGGTVVGATVGGRLVGTETVTVGTGGTAVGGDVGVGADPQAVIKTAARMSAMS